MKTPVRRWKTYREDNPLHNAFYVEVASGEVLEQTAQAIRQMEGIDSVNYGGEKRADVC